MILAPLSDWRLYAPQGSRLAQAFEYLASEWTPAVPDGRAEVDGDDVFALVQGYATRALADCKFEAHRRYIDIQYVHDGGEGMGWHPVEGLAIAEPHADEKDVAFFRLPGDFTVAEVRAGWFALFHPNDAHMPGLRIAGTDRVRKVVMKVRVG